MNKIKEQHIDRFSFVKIDLDRWLWAIVSDYEGPQDFGEVFLVFAEDHMPDPEYIDNVLYLAHELEWGQ